MIEKEFKTKEAWLEWRYDGVCASDVPIIMGVSKYASAEELFHSKVNRVPLKAKSKASERAMEESLALEGVVLDAVVKTPHIRQVYLEESQFRWMRCSLDAFSEDGAIIYEVKCLNTPSKLWNGICPIEYLHQLLWQLAVCDRATEIQYIEYNKKSEKLVHHTKTDLNRFMELVDLKTVARECRRFYEAVVAKDFSKFMEKPRKIQTEIKKLNTSYTVVDNFLKAKEELNRAQIEYDRAQEHLLAGLEPHVSYQHDLCCINRVPVRGRIRYEDIPQLAGVNLERYRGEDTFRTSVEITPFENMV
jgi:putative phage-type endonuclease